MVSADLVFGKDPFPGFPCCVPTYQKGTGSSVGSLYKSTHLIHEVSTLTT